MLGLGADIPKGGCGVEPTHNFCLLAAGCLLFSQSYNGPLPGAAQPEHMDLFFFSSAVREIEGRNWRNYPPEGSDSAVFLFLSRLQFVIVPIGAKTWVVPVAHKLSTIEGSFPFCDFCS